jgi:hypothetical protein
VLLDIGSVLGGIGLAVVAFVVVIAVCVVILRLLAAILPSYEDRDPRAALPEVDDQTETVDPAAEPGPAADPERAAEASPSTETVVPGAGAEPEG